MGDYLDFSIERNSMIITKNVIYRDNTKLLKTDVIEIVHAGIGGSPRVVNEN